MTFDEFKALTEDALRSGEVQLSPDAVLTEMDMAVQFAVGRIVDKKGLPYNMSLQEIEDEIKDFAGDRKLSTEGWFYETH